MAQPVAAKIERRRTVNKAGDLFNLAYSCKCKSRLNDRSRREADKCRVYTLFDRSRDQADRERAARRGPDDYGMALTDRRCRF